jgi:hypothetical protein
MFNITKKKYHKSNTFTFSQLKERLLVIDGQVQIIEATETFKGWDNLLNTLYSKFLHLVQSSKTTSSAATHQHL